MTNEEIMEAFAKNAAEIVRLERRVERLEVALKVAAIRFDSLACMDSRGEMVIKSCAEGAAAAIRETLK